MECGTLRSDKTGNQWINKCRIFRPTSDGFICLTLTVIGLPEDITQKAYANYLKANEEPYLSLPKKLKALPFNSNTEKHF